MLKDFKIVNQAYRKGALSDIEYVYRLAYAAADANLDEMMPTIAPRHLEVLQKYVATYKLGRMISINGAPIVPVETINKLRKWFRLPLINGV